MSIAGIVSRVRGAFTGARNVSLTVFLLLAATTAQATGGDPATLLHRWSFNGDLKDSVGGRTAMYSGKAAPAWNATTNAISLAGGARGTSVLQMGARTVPEGNFTLEIFATLRQDSGNYAPLFQLADATSADVLTCCWVSNNRIELNKGGTRLFLQDNLLGTYTLGNLYHVCFTVTTNYDGNGMSQLRFVKRNLTTGADPIIADVVPSAPWSPADLKIRSLNIGFSVWSGNYDPAADYDEIRVWDRVLTDDEIASNAVARAGTLPDYARFPDAAEPSWPSILHRWSFTENLEDGVGDLDGVYSGTAALTYTDGNAIALAGGARGVSSVSFGAGSIPEGDFTVELFAKNRTIRNWSRILEINDNWSTINNIYFSWTLGTTAASQRFRIAKASTEIFMREGQLGELAVNTPYQIFVSCTTNYGGSGQSLIRVGARDLAGANPPRIFEGATTAAWSPTNLISRVLAIGRSSSNDNDASATYDEVRVWGGVLTLDQLAVNAANGADHPYGLLQVAGNPVAAGVAEPAYGYTYDIASNTVIQCSATSDVAGASGFSGTCTGYVLYACTNGVETVIAQGSGSSFTHTAPGYPCRLVWLWRDVLFQAAADYQYVVSFTAPSINVGSDASLFQGVPVMVHLTDDASKFSYAKMAFPATGADLAFYDSVGNAIPHEIETWNPSGESLVWVRLPSLATGTTFMMAFGCSDTAKLTAQAPAQVWTGYEGVWHMNATNLVGGVTTTPDATANARAATVRLPSVSTIVPGRLGAALICEPVSGKSRQAGFVVPGTQALWGTSDFTISGWFRSYGGFNGNSSIFATKSSKTAAEGGFALSTVNTGSELGFYMNGSTQVKTGGFDMGSTSWTWMTIAYRSGSLTFYRNGAITGTVTPGANYTAAVHDFGIGAYATNLDRVAYYGEIDDVRWTKTGLTTERVSVDYRTVNEADFFNIQGVSHDDAQTITVTKFIPELDLDLNLPECHQTHLTDTNYTLTCSAIPRDYYYTTNDVAYRCIGYVFTPKIGEMITGSDPAFTFQPAVMGEGAIEWRFASCAYRARVHDVAPFLADKASITITPDDPAHHLFGTYYTPGTVLTVTLTEKEDGVFSGWRGPGYTTLPDPSAKTFTTTVAARGDNPEIAPELCGIVVTDGDTRIASDNCARVPTATYIYVATNGNDSADGLSWTTAIKSLSTAFTRATANYTATLGQQVICVGEGAHLTSGGIGNSNLNFPVVFEGGLTGAEDARIKVSLSYIQSRGWFTLTHPRAALRRLRLYTEFQHTGKDCNAVRISNGMVEGVIFEKCFTGIDFNAGSGILQINGGVVTNCLLTQCRSANPSAQYYTYGIVRINGGLFVSSRITDCTSEGTTGGYGGIYMTGGTVRNCLVDNNRAYTQGSGIYVNPGAVCSVENCTFADNGLIEGSAAGPYGAYLTGSSATKKAVFVNNIVYGNSGNGDVQKDIMNVYRANTTWTFLTNNIVTEAIEDSATTSGNIVGNPAFNDRDAKDYTTGRGAGVDKGYDLPWTRDPLATDLAGNPRIMGDALDIGCYEYEPSDELDVVFEVSPATALAGEAVAFTATATGGAGNYDYVWTIDGVVVTNGPDCATFTITSLMGGPHDVTCTVTDGTAATATFSQPGAVKVVIRHGYVSKTGSNTSPYDTWEKAARDVDQVMALLDPTAAVEVEVGPGIYDLTNSITLLQPTAFHSTAGAGGTFLRPAAGVCVFAFGSAGCSITGFTLEKLAGSAMAMNVRKPVAVTNLVVRDSVVTTTPVVLHDGVNIKGLTFESVTNTSGNLIYGGDVTGSKVGTIRNLIMRNCRTSAQLVSCSYYGILFYNGLIIRCKASNIACLRESASISYWRNVTVHDCVSSGTAFYTSYWSNTYTLRNCVLSNIWTDDTRTVYAPPTDQYCYLYNCAFSGDQASCGSHVAENCTDKAGDLQMRPDGRFKSISPLLDAGVNETWMADPVLGTDLAGFARIRDESVDIGCYEYQISGATLLLLR